MKKMKKRVLVIGTSPRLHGNSNRLAEEFAKGAELAEAFEMRRNV